MLAILAVAFALSALPALPAVFIAAAPAPFPVYDATGANLTGKPKTGLAGTFRAQLVYGWTPDGNCLFPDGPEHDRVLKLPPDQKCRALPDEAQVKRIAKAVPAGAVLIFDYEEVQSWQPDRQRDIDAHAEEYKSVGQVARWAREANSWVRIGFYNASPDGRNAAAGTDDGRFEVCLRLWMEHALPYLDFICDDYYVVPETNLEMWRHWMEWKTKRLRSVARRPFYHFLNLPDIDSPERARFAVDAIRRNADGAVLWANPGKTYDKRAAWVGLLK